MAGFTAFVNDGVSLVDLVINVADIAGSDGDLDDPDVTSGRGIHGTNVLGPLRLTQAMHPLLSTGSVVANISSGMGSIEVAGSDGDLDDPDVTPGRGIHGTNVLGPLRLTQAMHPLLSTGSVVANISSGMGSIEVASTGWLHHRMSRAALDMQSMALANELRRDGIIVASFGPGRAGRAPTWGVGAHPSRPSARSPICSPDRMN